MTCWSAESRPGRGVDELRPILPTVRWGMGVAEERGSTDKKSSAELSSAAEWGEAVTECVEPSCCAVPSSPNVSLLRLAALWGVAGTAKCTGALVGANMGR
jgi:hypothetical protein